MQRRLEDAVEVHEKALALSRKIREHHPDTRRAMNNLGVTYQHKGRSVEAIELQERAVTESRQRQGGNHPDTLEFMCDLAETYFSNGRQDDAVPLLERSLEGMNKVLGEQHPDTMRARNILKDMRVGVGTSNSENCVRSLNEGGIDIAGQ